MTDANQLVQALQTEPTDHLIGAYLQLRDHKKAAEKRFKEEMANADGLMNTIGNLLLERLARDNETSKQTAVGTAIRAKKVSATIADAQVFGDFVKETDRFDLIDWHANTQAVLDYIDQQAKAAQEAATAGQPPPNMPPVPPGVNLSSIYILQVRKK